MASFFILLLACGACGAAEPAAGTTEEISFLAKYEGSQEKQGASHNIITREAGKVHFIEEREATSYGKSARFDIVFDPVTLLPSSWTRIVGGSNSTVKTEVKVAGGKIESKVFTGDTVTHTSSIDVPATAFCLPPMLRYQIAKLVDVNTFPASFLNVSVAEDGSMKAIEVKVEDMGTTKVDVPAGSFQCRHLKVAAKSSMVSALVPPGDLFLTVEPPHMMIKMTMSPSRFSSTIVTEMQSRKTGASTTP
jgi:hypothetical protein